ncbi:hypothetical protein DFH27DRAFT_524279 [Peziza echinospora]|nr:hypothetical protein DFH27DRAFT_524279 [Peziza echinospora]
MPLNEVQSVEERLFKALFGYLHPNKTLPTSITANGSFVDECITSQAQSSTEKDCTYTGAVGCTTIFTPQHAAIQGHMDQEKIVNAGEIAEQAPSRTKRGDENNQPAGVKPEVKAHRKPKRTCSATIEGKYACSRCSIRYSNLWLVNRHIIRRQDHNKEIDCCVWVGPQPPPDIFYVDGGAIPLVQDPRYRHKQQGDRKKGFAAKDRKESENMRYQRTLAVNEWRKAQILGYNGGSCHS